MKIFGAVIAAIFAGVVIWQIWIHDNLSLQEYAGKAVIDVAADSAGEVIADAIKTKRDTDILKAQLRISELETENRAQAERIKQIEAVRERWSDVRHLYTVEIEHLKTRNAQIWEYYNEAQNNNDTGVCMPGLASVYDRLYQQISGSRDNYNDL